MITNHGRLYYTGIFEATQWQADYGKSISEWTYTSPMITHYLQQPQSNKHCKGDLRINRDAYARISRTILQRMEDLLMSTKRFRAIGKRNQDSLLLCAVSPACESEMRLLSSTFQLIQDEHQVCVHNLPRLLGVMVGNPSGARGKKVNYVTMPVESKACCFSRQCKEPKRKMDSQYFKEIKALMMEVKRKESVDAADEAFPR
ncbi:hypothetical protein Tco_1276393 [Tanacetum coccineum]